MKIGLLHFRVGETDGVSLEMEKWKLVLEELGHQVWYIAGSGKIEDTIKVSGLHYQNKTNDLLVNHIYKKHKDQYSEEEIKNILENYTEEIETQLLTVMKDYQFDVLIPNNVLSLGWNLAAGKAVAKVIEKTGIRVIAHHHDFHWERELYSNPKYLWVKDILTEYFPPESDQISHVVINNIAQKELIIRKQIESTIVPNVFDYEKSRMVIDDYNKNIKSDLGFTDDDILILQATRIVKRKGIELTIKSIASMNKQIKNFVGKILFDGREITNQTKIKLVMVGLNEDQEYFDDLFELANRNRVEIIHIGERFNFVRSIENGSKIYSLWDAYFLADIISYPSILEGFGNQLLEATYAKKPILLYEYPVYEHYIGEFGLDVISFGSNHLLDKNGMAYIDEELNKNVALKTLTFLTNANVYKSVTLSNYNICLENFSCSTLRKMLTKLINEI